MVRYHAAPNLVALGRTVWAYVRVPKVGSVGSCALTLEGVAYRLPYTEFGRFLVKQYERTKKLGRVSRFKVT